MSIHMKLYPKYLSYFFNIKVVYFFCAFSFIEIKNIVI